MAILDGVRRVLFAHAHPDDETLATGALIARLAREGVVCDVVTASRGELGEVVPGPLSHLYGTPELEQHRARELRGALDELGVAHHAYLGEPPARAAGLDARRYRDSGMVWVREGLAGPADTTDVHSFTAAPADEEVADLVALLRAWQPDLVISYNEGGGYGHPDHVRMHQVARRAAEQQGVTFASVHHHRLDGVEWLELADELPVVAAALRHHATQLTVQPDGTEVVHSGGQREAIETSCGLELAGPGTLNEKA